MFLAKVHAGHLVRSIHDKKQYKSDDVDTNQDWNGINNPA